MKIAFITNTYGEYGWGGDCQTVNYEVNELCKRGHEVLVIFDTTTYYRKAKHSKLPKPGRVFKDTNGAKVLDLATPKPFYVYHYATAKYLFKNEYAGRRIKSALKEFQPDIVHIHQISSMGLTPIKVASEQLKIPTVYTAHDLRFANKRLGVPVIAISENMASKFPFDETIHLHTGIPTPQRREKIKGKRIKVLYVGYMDDRKGAMRCINAINGDEQFELKLVGSGPLEKKLRNKCENTYNCTFLGKVSSHQLQELYQEADILLLPSKWEGLALVLIEAMSYGCAIISAKVGGLKEAVGDRDVGILIDNPNSVAEIKIALKEVALNLGVHQAEAVKRYEEEFSIDKHIDKLEQVYERLSQNLSTNTFISKIKPQKFEGVLNLKQLKSDVGSLVELEDVVINIKKVPKLEEGDLDVEEEQKTE